MNNKLLKSILSVTLLTVAGLSATTSHAASSLVADVKRSDIAQIDVITKRTALKDVVMIFGSLPAGDIFNPAGKPATAMLVAQMLDKGTARQDKYALANKLAEIGATITFDVDKHLATFQVTSLKQSLPVALALLAEQLRSPAFSAEEFDKLKPQAVAALQQQLNDTTFRAQERLAQTIYPEGHPNRPVPMQEMVDWINAAQLSDLKQFHAAHYGPAHMTMVIAGDIDPAGVRSALEKSFAGWKGGTALPEYAPSSAVSTATATEQTVFMPGKTSVSVVLGQATGLRYRDPDALALRVGTAVLGSGFTGRLTNAVRDKEGLTYTINSFVGNDTFSDGEWKISSAFAPTLLGQGIDSTRHVLNEWYEKGITAAELEQRKTQLTGGYFVGLATTGGIAWAMQMAVHRGYDLSWLDEYPKAIRNLTVEQVNAAIKKHLNPEKMALIQAGSVEE